MNVPPRRGTRNMKINDKDESCSLMEGGRGGGGARGAGEQLSL